MASGLSADLETVLDIVAADEQRDLAAATALSVRQGYEQLGAVAVGAEELATATETAAKVLQAAKSRRHGRCAVGGGWLVWLVSYAFPSISRCFAGRMPSLGRPSMPRAR